MVTKENTISTYNSINGFDKYASFYATEGLGVLETTKEFLVKQYGNENGELEVLSGNVDCDGTSVIVTDYFADSLIYHNQSLFVSPDPNDRYAMLTNGKILKKSFRISGVINTHYTERYADVIEMFQKIKDGESTFSKIKTNKRFVDFYNELEMFLNVAYSFSPNFEKAMIEDRNSYSYYNKTYGKTLNFGYSEQFNIMTVIEDKAYGYSSPYIEYDELSTLNKGEVIISTALLKALTNDDVISEDITGKTVYLFDYHFGDEDPYFYGEFTVNKVYNSDSFVLFLSPDNFTSIWENNRFPYQLYLDDLSNLETLSDSFDKMNFYPASMTYNAILQVIDFVDVFTSFFNLIVLVLCGVCFFLLIGFTSNTIKKHLKEIGVTMALGTKANDIFKAMLSQILIIGISVSIIIAVGLTVGVPICNEMVVKGFVEVIGDTNLASLTLIELDYNITLVAVLLIQLILILSIIIPFLKIKKIEPRNIINENK